MVKIEIINEQGFYSCSSSWCLPRAFNNVESKNKNNQGYKRDLKPVSVCHLYLHFWKTVPLDVKTIFTTVNKWRMEVSWHSDAARISVVSA